MRTAGAVIVVGAALLAGSVAVLPRSNLRYAAAAAVQAPCDADGVEVGYLVSYSPDPVAGYRVTQLRVGDLAADCLGAELSISLTQGGVELARGGPSNITGETMMIEITPAASAQAVDGVHIAISSSRGGDAMTPPIRCATMSFERTIAGSPDADSLTGTELSDLIVGLAGDDELLGLGGDDCLDGGEGGDVFLGGAGDDVLMGGADDDDIGAGRGADRAYGGPGDDVIRGNAGDDDLRGGGGDDTIRGGRGSDTLRGGSGSDTLGGGPGFDVCYGGRGRDRFAGCERVVDRP